MIELPGNINRNMVSLDLGASPNQEAPTMNTSKTAASDVLLSVLMPCHNEALIARQSVEQTLRVLKSHFDRPFEILLVDDGSTDGTSKAVEGLTELHPEVKLVQLERNGGKGDALRTAFSHAHGSLVCFLDGDLDIHPSHVVPFVKCLETEKLDIVIASKRHPDSRVDYPIERRMLSFAYQLLLRGLFGLRISDSQAGIKIFRREVLENVFVRGLVKRYAYDAELLVVADRYGYRIGEAPISMRFQSKYGSGVDLKAIVNMFVDTLGIFYRLRVTRYYRAPRKG